MKELGAAAAKQAKRKSCSSHSSGFVGSWRHQGAQIYRWLQELPARVEDGGSLEVQALAVSTLSTQNVAPSSTTSVLVGTLVHLDG